MVGQIAGAHLVKVRELALQDVVVGTAASGAFEGGPRQLVKLEDAPEHARREDAHRLWWADGTSQVLYGGTLVFVKDRRG